MNSEYKQQHSPEPLPASPRWAENGRLRLSFSARADNRLYASHDASGLVEDTSVHSMETMPAPHEKDVEAALLPRGYEQNCTDGYQPDGALAAPPLAEKDRVRRGMLWYACSSVFFSAMGICSKSLGEQGYTVWEITFVRSIIILCCSLSALAHGDGKLLGNRRGLLWMRGTLGYCSITCYFIACQSLPLADATVFTFLAPLIAALLSPVVLRERASPATFLVIPLSMIGVAMIIQPNFVFGTHSAQLSAFGLVFGLLQPFFSASAKMTVRALRTTEQTHVIILYLMMCTFVYSTIGCIATRGALIYPTKLSEWALLLGQGLAGYGNQICITNGLKLAKAASVMSMQYLSIVVSQAAGMLLFGEFTTVLGGLGMTLIVSSMLLFIMWESRK